MWKRPTDASDSSLLWFCLLVLSLPSATVHAAEPSQLGCVHPEPRAASPLALTLNLLSHSLSAATASGIGLSFRCTQLSASRYREVRRIELQGGDTRLTLRASTHNLRPEGEWRIVDADPWFVDRLIL